MTAIDAKLSAKLSDYNGDGKKDIFWHNSQTSSNAVWLMNGTTIDQAANVSGFYYPTGWQTVGMGDFNGDGKTDLLWRNPQSSYYNDDMWLMNGTSINESSYLDSMDSSWNVNAIGDFDGDGKTDMLCPHFSQNLER